MLDTDVIVAAMRSPSGASAAILRAARQGLPVLLSVPMALEYEAVCRQEEHRLAADLSDRQAEIFVTALIAMAEPVDRYFLWRPQLRDAGNEMVLETAVNGNAHAIVTFNLRHFQIAGKTFNCAVLLPREALRQIRSSIHETE